MFTTLEVPAKYHNTMTYKLNRALHLFLLMSGFDHGTQNFHCWNFLPREGKQGS